jgi:hypothetical protein
MAATEIFESDLVAINPRSKGVSGDGVTDNHAELTALLARTGRKYVFDKGDEGGTFIINDDLTLPSTSAWEVSPDNVLKLAAGQVLILPRTFMALPTKVFDVSNAGAKVTFAEGEVPEKVYGEWWGANPLDDIDSTPALNAAMLAISEGNGGQLQLRPGVYSCNDELILKDKVKLVGYGMDVSILSFEGATGDFDSFNMIFGQGSFDFVTTVDVEISHNIDRHAKAIRLTGDPEVVPGDLLLISDRAERSFFPGATIGIEGAARSEYMAGEFVKVKQWLPETPLVGYDIGAFTGLNMEAGTSFVRGVENADHLDVGKYITIHGAGPGGADLTSRILQWQSGTEGVGGYSFRLEHLASTTVVGGTGEWPAQIFLDNGVYGRETDTVAYVADADMHIYKILGLSCELKDFTVLSSSGTGVAGLMIQLGEDVRLSNLKVIGNQECNIRIDRSYNVQAEHVTTWDGQAAMGTNYGCLLSHSQSVRIISCNLTASRHGLAMGGDGELLNPPYREIQVIGCRVNSTGTAGLMGLDMHGNGEFILVKDCILPNGAKIGGDNAEYDGNHIWTSADGYGIYFSECCGMDHSIINNRFYSRTNQELEAAIIQTSACMDEVHRSGGTLVIEGNTFQFDHPAGTPNTGKGIYIWNTKLPEDVRINVVIQDNKFINKSDPADGSVIGCLIRAAAGEKWNRVVLQGNTFFRCSIFLWGVGSDEIIIEDNKVFESPIEGIFIQPNVSGPWGAVTEYTEGTSVRTVNDEVLIAQATGITGGVEPVPQTFATILTADAPIGQLYIDVASVSGIDPGDIVAFPGVSGDIRTVAAGGVVGSRVTFTAALSVALLSGTAVRPAPFTDGTMTWKYVRTVPPNHQYILVNDNKIFDPQISGMYLSGERDDDTIIECRGNTVVRCNRSGGVLSEITRSCVVFNRANKVYFLDNILGDDGTPTLIVHTHAYNDIRTVWEDRNQNIGPTVAPFIGGITPEIRSSYTGEAKNQRLRASAAPVGGTWEIGDITDNSEPATGEPIGWVYTATGWKAFGTIA